MPKQVEDLVLQCGHCGVKVMGKPHGRYGFQLHEDDLPEEWVLVSCRMCHAPNLVGREYYGTHNGHDEWGDWRIYPPRDRMFGPEVPKSIRESFSEASGNMRNGAHMSTALMCRRTIELLAKREGATGRDLAVKLEKLLAAGVMDATLYEWATALRLAGNDAAHSDDSNYAITKEDAEDLLKFTEAIIDFVYIFRARFKEFKKRRPDRKTEAKPAAAKAGGSTKKSPKPNT